MKKLNKQQLESFLKTLIKKLEPFNITADLQGDQSLTNLILHHPAHIINGGYCWETNEGGFECFYAFFYEDCSATIESHCPSFLRLAMINEQIQPVVKDKSIRIIEIMVKYLTAILPQSEDSKQLLNEINTILLATTKTKHVIYSDFTILEVE